MFATMMVIIVVIAVVFRMINESRKPAKDDFARIPRNNPILFNVDRIGKLVDKRI